MSTGASLNVLLWIATALLIACGAVRLRGTTLWAPAWWAMGSILSLAALDAAALAGMGHVGHTSPLRYAVAVTTLCPMMAVLGAKRPQDLAWQWVVVALLATLWLPAAKGWLLDSGETLQLFSAWQLFLIVLIVLGPLNYLPTRNWLAVLLVAAGQLALFLPYLGMERAGAAWAASGASLLFFLAVSMVWLHVWRRGRGGANESGSAAGPVGELDQIWLRFRDAFGAFWAVRVMQRVNQGLEPAAGHLELTWHGWSAASDAKRTSDRDFDSAASVARRALRTALRRFVRMS